MKEDTLLEGVLNADTVYNFCMCNPPFFSSEEELDPKKVARTSSRPLPRNAHSGAPGELVCEGGELSFVNKIIQDSLKLKSQIRYIFYQNHIMSDYSLFILSLFSRKSR